MQARTDADAYGRFYDRHADRVLVFFTRRVFQAEAAFDLMSETFAKAWERRAQFRGSTEEEAEGWLFAIARNELLTFFRRGGCEREALQRLRIPSLALTDGDIERIEELADIESLAGPLREAMTKLPPEQSAAVTMRVVDGAGYDEIAGQLRVTQQVARARVSRGLRALALAVRLDEGSASPS